MPIVVAIYAKPPARCQMLVCPVLCNKHCICCSNAVPALWPSVGNCFDIVWGSLCFFLYVVVARRFFGLQMAMISSRCTAEKKARKTRLCFSSLIAICAFQWLVLALFAGIFALLTTVFCIDEWCCSWFVRHVLVFDFLGEWWCSWFVCQKCWYQFLAVILSIGRIVLALECTVSSKACFP